MPRQIKKRAQWIAAEILNGFSDLVVHLGGKSRDLLDAAGLPPILRFKAGKRLPLGAVCRLLERSAAVLGCPDFGLRLAERQQATAQMRTLERLLNHAPNLEGTFRCGIDHMDAFSSGIRLTLLPSPDSNLHRLRSEILVEDDQPHVQLSEQMALLSHQTAIDLTGGRARSRAVRFAHARAGSKWAYGHRFSTTVEFDEDFDDVLFSDADLKAKVTGHDPDIYGEEKQRIGSLFPPKKLPFPDLVTQAIAYSIADARYTRDDVCAMLGITGRTMHRHLARSGTKFEALRDEVRRKLCLRYLERCDLSMSDVAFRLGFAEVSVLSHACQRWFSSSPRSLRKDLIN